MTQPPLPLPPQPVTVATPVFWPAVNFPGQIHAVADKPYIAEAVNSHREATIEVYGVCRRGTILATAWDRWDWTDPRLASGRCSYCSWHVAIHQNTTAGLLNLLHPSLQALCRSILEAEQAPTAAYDPDHPWVIQLLAHATDHGPWQLVDHEECGEGECEHEDEPCPGLLACQACTLTTGGWAGEWEGQPHGACTVPYPCSVTTLLLGRYPGGCVS